MGRHGENIHKRQDGRWEARVLYAYNEDGKAMYRYLYGRTYLEAKNKKTDFMNQIKKAHINNDQRKMTFQSLVYEWLDYRHESIKESTYVNYKYMIENHILPQLGHYYLYSMNNKILDEFLKEKLKNGRKDGKGGLSPKTVGDIRSLLILIIKYAQMKEYPINLTTHLFSPSINRNNIHIFSRLQQLELEKILFQSYDPIHLGILIALYCGLRIGEVCALTWEDIHLNEGTISVNKAISRIQDVNPHSSAKTKVMIHYPKTNHSIREVPIPNFLIEYLKIYQCPEDTYLLTSTKYYMEPRVCLNHYKKVLHEAHLNDFTFHALRHTFATRCIESGFDIKSLSEILGHANVNTTLQRYVHPSMEIKKEQMNRLENISFYNQNDK